MNPIYSELIPVVGAWPHDALVSLVNKIGMDKPLAGVLVNLWARSHEMNPAELEFDTATCGGGSPGELMSYRRRGKSSWGNLVAIRSASYVHHTYIWYALKANNPQRLRHLTRNELKIALGSLGPRIVRSAMRMTRTEFADGVTTQTSQGPSVVGPIERECPGATLLIRRKLGLSLGQFWRAARKGDAALVERLGQRPSARREALRRKGMTVAPPIIEPGLFDSPQFEGVGV